MKLTLHICKGISILINLSAWILEILYFFIIIVERDLFDSFVMISVCVFGVLILIETFFSIVVCFVNQIDTYDLNDNIETGKSKYSNIILAVFETITFIGAIYLCCTSSGVAFEFFIPLVTNLLLNLLYCNNNGLRIILNKQC